MQDTAKLRRKGVCYSTRGFQSLGGGTTDFQQRQVIIMGIGVYLTPI